MRKWLLTFAVIVVRIAIVQPRFGSKVELGSWCLSILVELYSTGFHDPELAKQDSCIDFAGLKMRTLNPKL